MIINLKFKQISSQLHSYSSVCLENGSIVNFFQLRFGNLSDINTKQSIKQAHVTLVRRKKIDVHFQQKFKKFNSKKKQQHKNTSIN